jgi:hypothetical protein
LKVKVLKFKIGDKIMSQKALEMISSVWIKFVAEKGAFGVKAISFFNEEKVIYADDVDFVFVFPARPRPGVANMNISTNGVVMKVRQPFVIDGEFEDREGKKTLVLRLHHQQ